jgi:hypothetical protein
MSKCVEIIAYSVKPEKIEEFIAIKNVLIKEASSLEGLVSSKTLKSLVNEHIFLDKMEWESVSHAEAGADNFKKLPTTPKFMALLDGPPAYANRFEEML